MTVALEDNTVVAVRYASRKTRRSEVFAGYEVYGEPDGPIGMHYFFYVLRLHGEVIVIDTGLSAEAAARRGYQPQCYLPDALAELGIEPAAVRSVILTHLHFDHTGHVSSFINAEFLLQRAEWEFWKRDGHRSQFAWLSEPKDLAAVGSAITQGRVRLLDGDTVINDRLSLLLTPGHTPGQQIVDLQLSQRTILASDAVHYYEELEHDRPFFAAANLEAMYHSYDRIRTISTGPNVQLVAGHDPNVGVRWPPSPRWKAAPMSEVN